MKAQEIKARLDSPDSTKLFADLYGNGQVSQSKKRLEKLIDATVADFPSSASNLRVFSTPGRTELGGNHTDHNRGKVLAASIQLDALACVTPREDSQVLFRSTGYPDVLVDISDTMPRKEETGTTEALVRGIASEFHARGIAIRGFTANATSTVLPGSGLSSSAAVEVLIGTIFNGLYYNSRLSAVEIAQIGQKAENIHFGKPSGLMDQVACASGGAVTIDFADPLRPLVEQVAFDLGAAGYALCVVDTGGNHADLTPDYAAVPVEMKAVAHYFGKEVLRDVKKADVLEHAHELRTMTGDRALLRAMHYYAENERVDAMLASLKAAGKHSGVPASRDEAIRTFLDLVAASGDSSWELLQNVFTTKLPSEQGVSLALALTREFLTSPASVAGAKGLKGVSRVHGGGFAGTIQAYIPLGLVEDYICWMKPIFGEKAVTVLRIRPIGSTELRP